MNVLEMVMAEVAMIGVVFEPVSLFVLNQAICAVPPAKHSLTWTQKIFAEITMGVAVLVHIRAILNGCTGLDIW